ncbi:MAG: hypothetical protein AAF567_00515 [Actinomycetota bacterium]
MPAPGAPNEPSEHCCDISRRRALKLAAATGAGTIVWAEPTIKGLARRPAYADAASNIVPYTVDLTPTSLSLNTATPATEPLTGITFALVVVDGGFAGITGTVTLTRTGCACTITSLPAALSALTLTPPLQPGLSSPTVIGGSLEFGGFGQLFTTATLSGADINANCETPT